MDLNREFARLVGLCWHEYDTETLNCIHCEKVMWRKDSNNPDYADPRLVLREMERIGKLEAFIVTLIYTPESNPETIDYDGLIPVEYILNLTGKLRDAAIKFMKEKEGT